MLPSEMLALYATMKTARLIDEQEQAWVAQNRAYFHVSGAGHESSAVLARHLKEHDWLHLHYRDKALLLARGLPIDEFLLSVLGHSASHSAGRQMSAHFSAPHLNVLSLVGPVGNNALQAVGVAAAIQNDSTRPIVVCSVGDGTTQQGEVLEAIAEAVRWQLPVLFLIHNNGYSISTRTSGKTFFSLCDRDASEFCGLPIQQCDGSDVVALNRRAKCVVDVIRQTRGPQILVLNVERLSSHTNADDQTQYRASAEIDRGRRCADPIENLRRTLGGVLPEIEIIALQQEIQQRVQAASERVVNRADCIEPGLMFRVMRSFEEIAV